MTRKSPAKKKHIPSHQGPLKLDLGSGARPAPGFEGVDIAKGVARYQFDLCSGKTWPWDDSSIDELRSADFIEHIKADYVQTRGGVKDALLHFFDEAYRVIKPNGIFTVTWPALQSVRAFQDPTHRRYIPAETMYYLSRQMRETMKLSHYTVSCNWALVSCTPFVDQSKGPYPAETQQQLYRERWNFTAEFTAVLRAEK